MKSGVYRIINIANNKTYIGSSVDIKKRLSSHFNSLRKKNHANSHLQRSFNKHGEDRFMTEVLIKCPIEELIALEQYLMDYYKPEYNIAKIAGSTLGVKPSLESRQKGAESRRIYYQNNPMSDEVKEKHRIASLGKKHTEENKKKLSKLAIERNSTKEGRDQLQGSKYKPVYQIDVNTLEIINEFRCIRDAGKANNIDQTYISAALIGLQNSAGGYLWSLVKDYSKEKILEIVKLINKPHYRNRPIVQYDLNMNFIREWDSIKFASEELNIKYGNISDAVRRPIGKSNGYIWRFKVLSKG